MSSVVLANEALSSGVWGEAVGQGQAFLSLLSHSVIGGDSF